MSNEQILDSSLASNQGGELNDLSKRYLTETAKWARFLAILGFVVIGIMILFSVIISVAFGTIMGNSGIRTGAAPGIGIGLVYMLFSLIYLYPTLKLYKFASNMLDGIPAGNTGKVTEGFENLKSLFKFMGIFTIIIFSFYLLIAVAAGLMGALR